MPEQKNVSLYQQQKAIKPLIEDIIPEFLDGDMRKSALDFVAHLRANKMKPVWCLTNQWNANYKGKTICKIHLRNGGGGWSNIERRDRDYWIIQLYRSHMHEYEETIMNDGLQNIIWDNIVYCRSCKPKGESRVGCAPGVNIKLLGKEIKGVCGCNWTTWIFDPDEATVNGIKRLLELEQKARTESVHKEI